MARRRKSNVKLGVGALVVLSVIGSVFVGGDDTDPPADRSGSFGSDSSAVSQQEESKDTTTVQVGDKTYSTDPAPADDQPPAETTDSTGEDIDAPDAQPDTPPAEDAPEQQDTTPTQQDDGQSDKVYVGSTDSDKYHKPTCRHAKKILESNQRWFASAEEAVAAGYSPCGTCKPKS